MPKEMPQNQVLIYQKDLRCFVLISS